MLNVLCLRCFLESWWSSKSHIKNFLKQNINISWFTHSVTRITNSTTEWGWRNFFCRKDEPGGLFLLLRYLLTSCVHVERSFPLHDVHEPVESFFMRALCAFCVYVGRFFFMQAAPAECVFEWESILVVTYWKKIPLYSVCKLS